MQERCAPTLVKRCYGTFAPVVFAFPRPAAPYNRRDMLTRVYIDNFRSFQNFEFKPEAKQLLLGTNGSGKTSLLEAIRRLKDFVDGNSNAFSQSTRTR
jgi:ABC-type uncharacterized transport system fused permease/ATPase subunit